MVRRWLLSLLMTLGLATAAWSQPPNRTEVTALFFLSDGKSVVAASLDDKLHIYDPATGKERFAVIAHKDGVYAVALSPDGKTLATGGGDGLVRLWDAAKFQEIASIEAHKKEVLALAFAPDGKTLASGGSDRAIRIWDLDTNKEKLAWHGHEFKVLSLAFAPDGTMLASAGTCTAAFQGVPGGAIHADQVRLWDPATGKAIRAHAMRGTTVAFLPDGRSLAAAGTYASGKALAGGGTSLSGGTNAYLGSVKKNDNWLTMQNQGAALALSPDGRLLALAYGNRMHLGRFLAENEMQHRRISIWETATGKEIMQVPQDGATVVAISPDGRKLAAGFAFAAVQFWDLTPPGWQGNQPNLDAKSLDKLWADLAEDGPGRAYEAIWTMSAAGDPAVAYLKDKLQPAKSAGDQVDDLLLKLNSDKFAVRETAFGGLKKLGPGIEAELVAALGGKVSPEVRKRVQKLLDSWDKRPASAEELQQVRAIQVLERVGSAPARAVLTRLADGTPGAWLTQQARLALTRLEMR
jgi:dipeptidyl aminopeptidase/acylaminoacyl peptidase